MVIDGLAFRIFIIVQENKVNMEIAASSLRNSRVIRPLKFL